MQFLLVSSKLDPSDNDETASISDESAFDLIMKWCFGKGKVSFYILRLGF